MQPHNTLLPGGMWGELPVTNRITLARRRSCRSPGAVSNPYHGPKVHSGKDLGLVVERGGAAAASLASTTACPTFTRLGCRKSESKAPALQNALAIFQQRWIAITRLCQIPRSGPVPDFSRCPPPASPSGRNPVSGRLLSLSFRRESPNSLSECNRWWTARR